MNMLDQFQKLDDLILEHTQPPVRAVLRNRLAFTREQVEAYQAASDKQDETLARQAEAIEALSQAKAKADKLAVQLQAEKEDLKEKAARAKRIPELRDTITRLTAEIKRCRFEVKTLKAEIKLHDDDAGQGYHVMQP
jgi:chromosome segregation ATPase